VGSDLSAEFLELLLFLPFFDDLVLCDFLGSVDPSSEDSSLDEELSESD